MAALFLLADHSLDNLRINPSSLVQPAVFIHAEGLLDAEDIRGRKDGLENSISRKERRRLW